MTALAADLTMPQILDFRQNWIRDQWYASPVNDGLSEFNRSRKANFFSDGQLQTAYDRIITEWQEELAAIQYEKEQERLVEEDDAATATAAGDALREQAVFRLLRVWCRRLMAEDPGYRASLAIGMKDATAILQMWEKEIAQDLAWVRSRSGRFNTIEIERG